MFASSLVPPERSTKWEFIPIGKRRPPQQSSSPEVHRMAINSDKISNSQIDTSFENTDNTETQNSMKSQIQGVSSLTSSNNARSGGLFDGFFRQRDKIVGDGGGSVQELTSKLETLQQENYNLKFEVATLTKYMRKTPEEQRNMVYENMELKQKLAHALEELDTLKTGSETVEASDSPQRAMDAIKSSYKEALAEKDDIIMEMRAQLEQLRTESSKSHVSDELYERLERLQNENQSLRRKLTDSASQVDLNQTHLHEENNELRARVHQLELQQSKVPSDANERISELESECQILTRKLREAVEDLKSVEGEKETIESNAKSLKSTRDALEQRIDSLNHELKVLQDERDSLDALVRQIRSKDPGKEKQIDDLQAQMSTLSASSSRREQQLKEAITEARELRARIRAQEDDLLEKQHEVDRLSRKNAHLESELASSSSVDKNRGRDSSAKFYEDQIEELRLDAQKMKSQKRDLEDVIADLEDQLSNRLHLKNDQQYEIDELHERVDFYEKEYNSLVEEMERSTIKYESLKEDLDAKETQLEKLKAELRIAQRESQRSDPMYYELEKKRDEDKIYRLERQVESVTSTNRQLEREIEEVRRLSDVTVKDKERLLAEVHELESKMKDSKLAQSKLETNVRDKEEIIDALESRLRSLSRDVNGKRYEESYAAKAEVNYEMQCLQREKERSERELERLQKELTEQQRYYENKIDLLKERTRIETMPDDSAMVALLESQLEELKRDYKALQAKQNDSRKTEVSAALDDYRERIAELESRLSASQKDKNKLKEVIDNLETDMKVLASEKTQFEIRAKNLDSELTKTTRHCNRLARKINDIDIAEYKNSSRNSEEIVRVRKANAQLQAHIDSLNAKLAQVSTPNPFIAPRHAGKSSTEQRLQQNELLFYKAKLYDLQNKANDIASVHLMVMSSLRNADAEFRNELAKTALLGIHPDFERQPRKKPTFKAVAQFVLAAVKIKNRHERAAARRKQLLQLREEIEKDRITLLAE
ncbi:hypothetical protein ACI3L0_001771 [Candidozyma auris]